ncbi:MAG TPA: sensor histidine kinase, partial [Actinomycetota bacterium]|nr:sensor histidine kinase [Actinomycetota bacterium]
VLCAAAVLAAGAVILSTYERALAGHRAELLFAEIIGNAHRHAALDMKAVADGELSAEVLVQSDLARSLMARDLAEVSWLPLPRGPVARIRAAYDRYRGAIEAVYQHLLDGEIAAARVVHDARVEPAFRDLEEAIDDAQPVVLRVARDGDRAVRLAVGLVVLGGVGAVLLCGLFIRARRRSEMAALERRTAETIASERRRLLEQTIRAAERERILVAGDLHDGPLQRLTAITFKLERVAGRLRRGDAAGAGELLGSVQAGMAEEIGAIRDVVRSLRPPVLEESGLGAALRDHVRALEGSTGLRCTVRTDLASRLDREVEVVLYRVAQEALTNAIKHARAGNVWVSVLSENGTARLVVRDDGVGFEPTDSPELVRTGHFGLASMRERVEMAGGSLRISSAPGRGTTLEAVLPNPGGHG